MFRTWCPLLLVLVAALLSGWPSCVTGGSSSGSGALIDSVVSNNVQRTWPSLRPPKSPEVGGSPQNKDTDATSSAESGAQQQVFRDAFHESNSFLRRLTRKGPSPATGQSGGGPSSAHKPSGPDMSSVSRPLGGSRQARGGSRLYDVPQIECPPADDGMERFACPGADALGRYRCIEDHALCDGFVDCPDGSDEDRMSCMFYKTTKAHMDVLADALLRWARGRY